MLTLLPFSLLYVPIQQSLSSSARRRLQKELMQLVSSPPEGIRVDLEEHDILAFEAWIQGPGKLLFFFLSVRLIGWQVNQSG